MVDEAAQGTEPETLIPLSVVAPPEECSNGRPIFVMAGDQKQLGPRTASRLGSFEASLFERLFSRPLYSEHPLSRQGISRLGGVNGPNVVLKLTASLLVCRVLFYPGGRVADLVSQPYNRPPFTNLLRNYRSHPAILAIPSALFYHDTLIAEAADIDGLANWEGWKRKNWPVLFLANGGQDEPHEEGVSFYNPREVAMACKTARRFVDSGLLQPHEIAIMSPFWEQVRRIRAALRGSPYNLRGINVGPLEVYQGAEHKLVILCTTRARERFLDQDLQRGLGIIFESKKFNVAMTRAKQGLIVVGNPWILQKDPSWLAFLSFCWRNGAVEHDSEEVKPVETTDPKGTQFPNLSIMGSGGLKTTSSNGNNTRQQLPNSDGNLKSINLWQPSEDEQGVPQYLSRLEQSLLMKNKLAGYDGYIPKPLSSRFDDEDPMWTAGIAAEDALRCADFDLDGRK